MSNDTKLKISTLVAQWELNNYATFMAFVEARKAKTDNLKDKFGEVGDYIERILYEIPEGLDIFLNRKLDDTDKEFLRSKIGGQWFARTFMQYNVTQKT